MIKIGYIRKHYGGNWAFLRYWYHGLANTIFGAYKKYARMPAQINRVVFVCRGNICRSSLAEWAFKSKSNLPCVSFGIETVSNGSANTRIAGLAKKYGIDLELHKTTSVNDIKFQKGDLYVCMEPAHIEVLRDSYKLDNLLLFGLLDSSRYAYIHDPYSSDPAYAEHCVKKILALTDVLVASVGEGNKSTVALENSGS